MPFDYRMVEWDMGYARVTQKKELCPNPKDRTELNGLMPKLFDFDAFRKGGPWFKSGDIARAKRRWIETVKTPEDFKAITVAKEEYRIWAAEKMRIQIRRGATPSEARHYVQQLSTWMGRWRDYVPEEREEVIEDEKPEDIHVTAQRIFDSLTKQAEDFMRDKSAHTPDASCRRSKTCRYCHANEPKIPTLGDIQNRLTAKG